MAASGRGDEVAVQAGDDRLTANELLASAWAGAEVAQGAPALAYVVAFAEALPYTETGKLLRRAVQADLIGAG
jgi:acyl-coenzyme A synthetase/AMP-(fatty) acid ligase